MTYRLCFWDSASALLCGSVSTFWKFFFRGKSENMTNMMFAMLPGNSFSNLQILILHDKVIFAMFPGNSSPTLQCRFKFCMTLVIFAMFPGNRFPNLRILILQIRLNNLVSKVDATFDSRESNSVSFKSEYSSNQQKAGIFLALMCLQGLFNF